MIDISKWTDEQYGLLHDTRRSIRYHSRRINFLYFVYSIIPSIAILLNVICLNLINEKDYLSIILTVIAIIFISCHVIIRISELQSLHHVLRYKYVTLEVEILTTLYTDTEAWKNLQIQSLKIEQDEPPIYRALDLLCREEVNALEGIKPEEDEWHTELKWYQRLTANIFKCENIEIN